MVPHGRGALVVVVLKDRATRCPRLAQRPLCVCLEAPVDRAPPGVARWDVPGGGQVPRLGVSVAPVGGVAAVEMSHDGDGARIGRLIAAVLVATLGAPGRIGPVQRLIDGEQVWAEVPARLDEAVDPLDAHRTAPVGLDRERRVVERAGMVHRPVTPDRCRPQPHAVRQDPLPELPHCDLVVVDRCRLPGAEIAAARHGRRITSGATYLGIERGSSTPSAAGPANARPPSKRQTSSPTLVPAPYWMNRRRLIPFCRTVGGIGSMV